MDWKKDNALDFELKFFRHVRFWKNFRIQNAWTFWFILLRENDIFCIFGAFLKKHDFVLKFSLPVRFWLQKNTTRQILEQFFFVLSDFQ